ncbi:hypothetical protein Y694_04264 [Methylibium sp. T29-B]|nr:hypothetical protein Y694_04264 [Methylibium sp. T29-B]
MVEAGDERVGAVARQPAIGGLRPNTPHSELGTRIEPLVSEPRVSGTWPAAMAAPEPPDEPPALRARSCGLWVAPAWLFSVVKP